VGMAAESGAYSAGFRKMRSGRPSTVRIIVARYLTWNSCFRLSRAARDENAEGEGR